MSAPRAVLVSALALGLLGAQRPEPQNARTPLLGAVGEWKALPADGVEMRVSAGVGPASEPALRIDYDFHGRGGWAAARRTVAVELPVRYEIRYQLHGVGPANNLELKLVDGSGDNVWWHVDRARDWPREWTPVRVKGRQIAFAWGPTQDKELRRFGAIEITVSAAEGGRGTLWVAGLELVAMPPLSESTGPPTAQADANDPGYPAAAAVDGDERSAWRPGPGGGTIAADLGGLRELGGVTLVWERRQPEAAAVEAAPQRGPRKLTVQLSADGKEWSGGAVVARGGAMRSEIPLPDAEARYLRVRLPAGACGEEGCGLAELIVRPLAYGASKNDFITALAAESPRGTWPRGFSEAVYWTVVGVAGAHEETLLSEDGVVELRERGPSLEPFVRLGDRLFTWADVETSRSLASGDLPMPTVRWTMPEAHLEVTPLAAEQERHGRLLARYRLVNESSAQRQAELVLAARPFQVDPPYQFLNGGGGVATLPSAECDGDALRIWSTQVAFAPEPSACGTLAFDEGPLRERLAAGDPPTEARMHDASGMATAAMRWMAELDPGAAIEVVACFDGCEVEPPPVHPQAVDAGEFAAAETAARESWRAALGRVDLDLPPEAAPLLRSLRSNLAWILIHRDGPAIQPGSRAYARSWIRDGALTGVALLRLRHADEPREFARWFAEHQYPDGKVPCCVDRRGADPVPENDSHGELIHLIAEVYRYTGDRDFAAAQFSHVAAAVDAMEALRQQRRTDEYRAGGKQLFFGLLPESISHEGYSAKPVHSYWDDTFAYRGLDDAVTLARTLGKDELAAKWSARRDQFRDDLLASIDRVRAAQHLAFLPASADLADFDSTSTTTMLDPGGLLPYLPREAVEATFERFWRELVARRDGMREWEGYTPYELRHVGSFVRLSVAEPKWKTRAHELLAWYLRDQRPPGWNAWPEAVHHDYRAPKFLGDLPHGWVGSDFIRSFLDLFAFEREDGALVLGAGVPASWLDYPEGVAVRGLATPWGLLEYSLTQRPGGYRFGVRRGLRVPAGGIVLVPPSHEPGQVATIDGVAVPAASDGTITVRRLPVVVDFFPAKSPVKRHGP